MKSVCLFLCVGIALAKNLDQLELQVEDVVGLTGPISSGEICAAHSAAHTHFASFAQYNQQEVTSATSTLNAKQASLSVAENNVASAVEAESQAKSHMDNMNTALNTCKGQEAEKAATRSLVEKTVANEMQCIDQIRSKVTELGNAGKTADASLLAELSFPVAPRDSTFADVISALDESNHGDNIAKIHGFLDDIVAKLHAEVSDAVKEHSEKQDECNNVHHPAHESAITAHAGKVAVRQNAETARETAKNAVTAAEVSLNSLTSTIASQNEIVEEAQNTLGELEGCDGSDGQPGDYDPQMWCKLKKECEELGESKRIEVEQQEANMKASKEAQDNAASAHAEGKVEQAHRDAEHNDAVDAQEQCDAEEDQFITDNTALREKTNMILNMVNKLQDMIQCLVDANADQGCAELEASLSAEQTSFLRVVQAQARPHADSTDAIKALLKQIADDQTAAQKEHDDDLANQKEECVAADKNLEEKAGNLEIATDELARLAQELETAEDSYSDAHLVYTQGAELHAAEGPILSETEQHALKFINSFSIVCV